MPPPQQVLISPTLYMEDDSQWLIEHLQPIAQANHVRYQILDFLNQLIRQKIPNEEAQLFICGSTCSRTYLPDSDIDLTLITPNYDSIRNNSSNGNNSSSGCSSSSSSSNSSIGNQNHMKYLIDLSTTFIEEIYRRDRDRDLHSEASWKLSSAGGESVEQDFPIRNVEFINARVKLLHCVVRNVGIDITVNQRGVLGSLLFIEEADKTIGCDHLLKKSILLIKAWCLYECVSICGVPIIGAKEGMFSSYALTVMVLHLFNRYGNSLRSPFAVLRMFFYFYHGFPWETSVLTLEGPKPIQSGGSSSFHNNNLPKELQGKYQLCANQFKHIPSTDRFQKQRQAHLNQFKDFPSSSGATSASTTASSTLATQTVNRFPIRACNIQDPADESNNLGVSVSRNNLQVIDKALYYGYTRMEQVVGVMGQILSMYHTNSSNGVSNSGASSIISSSSSMSVNGNSGAGGTGGGSVVVNSEMPIASGRNSPTSSSSTGDPQRRGSKRGGNQGNGAVIANFSISSMAGATGQLFPSIAGETVSGNNAYSISNHQPGQTAVFSGTSGAMLIQPASAPTPSSKYAIANPTNASESFPSTTIVTSNTLVPPTSVPSQYSAHNQNYLQNPTATSSAALATNSSNSIPSVVSIAPRGLFVQEMFPNSMMRYIMAGSATTRPDLLLHPLQKGSASTTKTFYDAQKHSVNQCSNVDDHVESPQDPFESNIEEMIDTVIARPKPVVSPNIVGNKVCSKVDEKESGAKEDIRSCPVVTIPMPASAENYIAHEPIITIPEKQNQLNSANQGHTVVLTTMPPVITSKSKKRKERERQKEKEREKLSVMITEKKEERIPSMGDLPSSTDISSSEEAEVIENSVRSKNSKQADQSSVVDTSHKTMSPSQNSNSCWRWIYCLFISLSIIVFGMLWSVPVDSKHSSITSRIQLGGQYYWMAFVHGVCNANVGDYEVEYRNTFQTGQSVSQTTASGTSPQSCSDSNASRFDALTHLITHWVQLGDTVTFGDFSGSTTPSNINNIVATNNHRKTIESTSVYIWQKDFQYLTTTQVPYFTIVNSQFEDAGHYRCLKMMGSTSFLVTETIIRISRKPTAKSSPFLQELKQGASFRFELDYEGYPMPFFQWFKNGYKIDGQNSNILQLSEVDPSHTGTYSCELSNIAGSMLWLEGSLLVSE